MPEVRYPSDGSVNLSVNAVEEVESNGLDINPVDSSPQASTAPMAPNAPLVLNEVNSLEHTAYKWPSRKKWMVLTVVALCQTSMSKYIFGVESIWS